MITIRKEIQRMVCSNVSATIARDLNNIMKQQYSDKTTIEGIIDYLNETIEVATKLKEKIEGSLNKENYER